MALTDPVLLAQWDRERNGDLTPDDVTHGSHRRVWWRCEKVTPGRRRSSPGPCWGPGARCARAKW